MSNRRQNKQKETKQTRKSRQNKQSCVFCRLVLVCFVSFCLFCVLFLVCCFLLFLVCCVYFSLIGVVSYMYAFACILADGVFAPHGVLAPLAYPLPPPPRLRPMRLRLRQVKQTSLWRTTTCISHTQNPEALWRTPICSWR